jgi:hypothetical protein
MGSVEKVEGVGTGCEQHIDMGGCTGKHSMSRLIDLPPAMVPRLYGLALGFGSRRAW